MNKIPEKINLGTLVKDGTKVALESTVALITGAATLGIGGTYIYFMGEGLFSGDFKSVLEGLSMALFPVGFFMLGTGSIAGITGESAIRNLKELKDDYNYFMEKGCYGKDYAPRQ